jgi:hypothetical protein
VSRLRGISVFVSGHFHRGAGHRSLLRLFLRPGVLPNMAPPTALPPMNASTQYLVCCGMPGIEKRLASYPQFYSRIGFVHEFRPLAAKEIRQMLDRWTPPSAHLPQRVLAPETVAAISRITGRSFRLLNRLLAQMERILEINSPEEVTKAVVEAAGESLVIGQV